MQELNIGDKVTFRGSKVEVVSQVFEDLDNTPAVLVNHAVYGVLAVSPEELILPFIQDSLWREEVSK